MIDGLLPVALSSPLVSIAAFSAFYWLVLHHFTGEARRLKHLPTFGFDAPLLSFLTGVYFVIYGQKTVATGAKRWPNMFKISEITNWLLITSNPQMVDELRKAPEHVLSSISAIEENLQLNYTMGDNICKNIYHIPIIRAQLTRSLPAIIPEILDEVEVAFKEVIPPTDEYTSHKVMDSVMKVISRTTNRVFVGLPLCRDTDFLKHNIQFTVDVMQTSTILRLTPIFLRPIVNSLISNVPNRINAVMKHMVPVIHARRKERSNGDKSSQPLDMLTWLMDEANEEESTDRNLTLRIMTVNFAAIHTSTMGFTHVVYYIAMYPQYIDAIREEVENVVGDEGWTKAAVDKMQFVDSFIKETQRLSPLGILALQRVAVDDYKFSDGTLVPRGTTVCTSIEPAHLNGAIYEDPHTFDPYRFIKMKARNEAKKFDMVSTSCDSLAFGHGIHACPGRYFAACELKLMLAYMVTNYDLKLEKPGVHPPDMFVATTRLPNTTAQVMFRRRQV